MKVTVIGAGEIGDYLVRSLAGDPLTSGIYWLNRSYPNTSTVEDIEQSLPLMPTCRFIETGLMQGELFERSVKNSDAVVVTAGKALNPKLNPNDPENSNRDNLYSDNCEIFLERYEYSPTWSLCKLLKTFKPKFLLIVTNPVDLMTRFICRMCHLHPARTVGLGTTVETARLRSQIAIVSKMCGFDIPHSDIFAYAIGTHNKHFAAVIPETFSTFGTVLGRERETIEKCAAELAARGPERIKQGGKTPSFTIVAAILAVLRAVAQDRREILTVSLLDEYEPDDLFYSVPAMLGSGGVVHTARELLKLEKKHTDALDAGKKGMREILGKYPDKEFNRRFSSQ